MVIDQTQNRQDTLRNRILPVTDTFRFGKLKVFTFQDSLRKIPESPDSMRQKRMTGKIRTEKVIQTDTVSVCEKNPFAYITFHDSASFVWRLDASVADRVPDYIVSAGSARKEKLRAELIASLKEGEKIVSNPYSADWIVPVLLISAALFALVRSTSGDAVRNLVRFFSFRASTDNPSRHAADLFQWHSTLVNLASFISISLFGWMIMIYNGFSPGHIPGFSQWLICLGIVITGITMRHIILLVTGNLSSSKEIFSEYTAMVYQSYRIAGILFMIISVLILYTRIITPGTLFFFGILIGASLYIIRVFKLFLIFVTRRVSILYLILYLCALEILPVAVLTKYVTGLF